jgi:hypothetical protein
MASVHALDISRSTDAPTLIQLGRDIDADLTLDDDEKKILQDAIKARFGRLNAGAMGEVNKFPRGRWTQ